MQVHDGGARRVFYPFKGFYQRGDIVAVFHVYIIKAERFEIVVFRLAARLTQERQVAVQAAVVGGDGHFVIVYHDDNVAF